MFSDFVFLQGGWEGAYLKGTLIYQIFFDSRGGEPFQRGALI